LRRSPDQASSTTLAFGGSTFVARLTYETDGGAALAYRFERFEERE
jgi:hypothetical protein